MPGTEIVLSLSGSPIEYRSLRSRRRGGGVRGTCWCPPGAVDGGMRGVGELPGRKTGCSMRPRARGGARPCLERVRLRRQHRTTATSSRKASVEQMATAAVAPGPGPGGLLAMEAAAGDDCAGCAEEEEREEEADEEEDEEADVEGNVGSTGGWDFVSTVRTVAVAASKKGSGTISWMMKSVSAASTVAVAESKEGSGTVSWSVRESISGLQGKPVSSRDMTCREQTDPRGGCPGS